jgi:hypothetical protein
MRRIPIGTLPSWIPDWTAKSTEAHFLKRGIPLKQVTNHQFDRIDVGDAVEIGKLQSASGNSTAIKIIKIVLKTFILL